MVNIYLVRHGKTMFNTLGRAQGWSDTPLTKLGERGIQELGLGFKAEKVKFDRAYSSDLGRTLQTMRIILKFSENEGIPYTQDERIREWNYGSFDGDYDADLFLGLIPRVILEQCGPGVTKPTDEELANALYQIDTAGWAEPWEVLRGRILEGFYAIAKEAEDLGAENIIIVDHGMTIGTFVKLIAPELPRPEDLDNGSVTHLTYENGVFKVGLVGDMSYRELGQEILEK
jgi:probable phosphoglycerate mutase